MWDDKKIPSHVLAMRWIDARDWESNGGTARLEGPFLSIQGRRIPLATFAGMQAARAEGATFFGNNQGAAAQAFKAACNADALQQPLLPQNVRAADPATSRGSATMARNTMA